MKYLYAALPVLASVSAVTAQSVVGVHFIADDATVVPSGPSGSLSAATSETSITMPSVTAMDASAMPTPAPASTSEMAQYGNQYGNGYVSQMAQSAYGNAYTDVMPYASMTQGGYQQMACGYGYARQSQQDYCVQQPWVRFIFLSTSFPAN